MATWKARKRLVRYFLNMGCLAKMASFEKKRATDDVGEDKREQDYDQIYVDVVGIQDHLGHRDLLRLTLLPPGPSQSAWAPCCYTR